MHDLSGFQRDLLYVISGMEEPSGQQAKEQLEQYLDGDINHGRLYPNLDTLVTKEYVEKGPIDRRTNYYAITERGKDLIRERRTWEEAHISFEE
ncbi:PadR family transcriptional regulator [Haloprofundus marisrubri]|uniref:PadR family transcriptional regulator n=1 Tax=Haloprofundus marisrubri TaxID=1514971 RepID=A0A0W1R2R9_9EURY|nr:helix-turn-helix transcriptional regulator [Haloprofundus marisrubri]KTG07776.1 PadR family transcriptional regulator [Haloprofundus marisrubri]